MSLSRGQRRALDRITRKPRKITPPLRLIVGRHKHSEGYGMVDVLECGHSLQYMGDQWVRRRRCDKCLVENASKQLTLW